MSEWIELTIAGPRGSLEALLREETARTFSDCHLDIADESVGERILEAVHLDTHHRVYLPATEEAKFLERLAAHSDLRLQGRKTNVRGRFSFEGETPSRAAAEKIRAGLAELPEGADVRHEESEKGDPTAQEVHLYDHAHSYTYSVKGEAEGPAPGIFELHRRLDELEFVEAGRLEVEAESEGR